MPRVLFCQITEYDFYYFEVHNVTDCWDGSRNAPGLWNHPGPSVTSSISRPLSDSDDCECKVLRGLNRTDPLRTRASPVAHTVKRLPAVRETLAQSLAREDPLEKGMATHSGILAWRTPWIEEPGGLQSTGSQGVGHD